MSAGRRWPGPHAPIGVQLVALLLTSLLIAQAIGITAILLMPPPRPEVYHMSEVAQALRGGALHTRFGRPLIRTAASQLPGDLQAPAPRRERARAALAAALGLPEARVRYVQQPTTEWRLFRGLGGRRHGPPPGDFGPPPGTHGWAHGGPGGGLDMPIIGQFAAAAETGGRWVVVRNPPEPFPSEWQARAAMWLFACFLVVAPAGYLFARRITAPLKRFAAAAEQLGRDPHAPQMLLSGPAEVGMAARAFNEMQGRLKRYISDRTAMVGAISHDLRTPLSRIRFKMEQAPPALKASVLADVAQMEQMIGGVLAFIRDEGQPRHRERLDLLSVLECVADDAAMLGGDVEIVESAPVTVDGDAVALQRLFGNLVDNAVKYGGEARIRVRQDGEAAVVEIADRGPGLRPDDLERAFQPFFRADPARNPDKGGVGLGLPIARSAARAHGGDVQLEPTDAGLRAVVTLPAL